MPLLRIAVLSLLALWTAGMAAAQDAAFSIAADPYTPDKPLKGDLKFVGSRTMSQLISIWIDGFQLVHPEVKAEYVPLDSQEVFGKLSGTESNIGLISMALSPADQEAYAKANPKHKLVQVTTTVGAVAVIVHPENPIAALNKEQLTMLFGQNDAASDLTWGSIGLTGDWAKVKVNRFTPDGKSGTSFQFKSLVLGADGKIASSTSEAWHGKIVADVAADKGAIGVTTFASAQSKKVRAVPVSLAEGATPVPLTAETVGAGQYPLVRPLSMIVVAGDDGAMDPLVAEFVRYVLSQSGQSDVIKDGLQPLSRDELMKQYDRLGWNRNK